MKTTIKIVSFTYNKTLKSLISFARTGEAGPLASSL